MTQTADLLYKMAEFFRSEEFFEKGEDARLELSPDDVRCMNKIIKACGNAVSRQAFDEIKELMTDMHGDTVYAVRMSDIRQLPSVKPQEKKGHWISFGVQGEMDGGQIVQAFTCSECGTISIFRMRSGNIVNGDICPNCGAKMEDNE